MEVKSNQIPFQLRNAAALAQGIHIESIERFQFYLKIQVSKVKQKVKIGMQVKF